MDTTLAFLGAAKVLLDGAAIVGVLVGLRLAVNAAEPTCPACGGARPTADEPCPDCARHD